MDTSGRSDIVPPGEERDREVVMRRRRTAVPVARVSAARRDCLDEYVDRPMLIHCNGLTLERSLLTLRYRVATVGAAGEDIMITRRLVLIAGILLSLATPAGAAERFITVASTTSTENSGLFTYLLPLFIAETGIEVRVVAQGTGQA